MKISMIWAEAENGTIGRNNNLPWHLPDDFRYFKETTSGHPIIMGRKSFESLGKPLPKRTNIIITRNPDFRPAGVTVVNSLEEGIQAAQAVNQEQIFIIGGAEIYRQALPLANTLYITEVHKTYEGDAHAPYVNRSEWNEVSRIHHPVDERHETSFDFVVLTRK
ncbi:dihydrofolate reductase [Arsenicibacter rosenii]|uniref:Dihydrofolate reductase n=1 Tax=Arsenicibacter rosenii TaxID=1750698 RepID=A0A1S2VC38_9BACT|nr:dihydrofolate reductase [Arsenicibacter rosenii]OIN56273.1 diacylglycerol kinase [Arsenicibacter rosenii]